MEGSPKGLSPLKYTGENNENHDSNQDMIPKFQGQKKMANKHFMSPTISAASKAATPRKKVLAERNEDLSHFDTSNHKKSNPAMKKSSSPRVFSSNNHASKANNDYDPLTNYLSPRPKYLRFNPNRRLQILNRLEKEGIEVLRSSSDSKDDDEESSVEEIQESSFSPSKESVVKPRIEENGEDKNMSDDYDEEEDEKDEVVEERGWCVRVLKVVLTLFACFLSTSYICSMNSPTPSPAQLGIWNMGDGYFMIKNQTLEVVGTKLDNAGFLEKKDDYGDYKEVEFNENGESEEIVEAEINESVNEGSKDEIDEVGDDYGGNEKVEIDLIDDNGENDERVETEMYENENEEAAEVESAKDGEFEQFVAAETDESVESFNLGLNEDNVDMIEVADIEVVGNGEVESEKERFEQLIASKTDESGNELEIPTKAVPKEEIEEESKGVDNIESSSQELSRSDEKLNDLGHNNDEMGWKLLTVSGVVISVVFLILTSLTFVSRSKKSRNVSNEESKPVQKPVKEKKLTSVLPSTEKKIEFFARPSFPNMEREAFGEINCHISPPTVELIGEITFGHGSNNIRDSSMKPSDEGDVSFSTTSSASYGSFTTETKILKKEGGQSKEAMIEVATPVRRSSRLRNRAAVTSP